jgi:hypothetical protein
LRKKYNVVKLIIGEALYEEYTIKQAIHDLHDAGEITDKEKEWALENIDRLVHLNDKIDEEFYYFGED